MANILDKYGIKEVADVTFYEVDDKGQKGEPVLYLDTLKVSTIEQTAEEAEARGGKGNPPLIVWDYGKEINVTLEDALFSAKSMAIMFGDGKAKASNATGGMAVVTKTFTYKSTLTTPAAAPASHEGLANYEGYQNLIHGIKEGKTPSLVTAGTNAVKWYAEGNPTPVEQIGTDGTYYCVCTFNVATSYTIDISPNSFPGTYYVVGDTYARSSTTGDDEFFQFIIPKAKVQSENTITLEAEGDPSVFNLNLRVLRPATGPMMQLVKYDIAAS